MKKEERNLLIANDFKNGLRAIDIAKKHSMPLNTVIYVLKNNEGKYNFKYIPYQDSMAKKIINLCNQELDIKFISQEIGKSISETLDIISTLRVKISKESFWSIPQSKKTEKLKFNVFKLISQGHTVKEISKSLSVRYGTVSKIINSVGENTTRYLGVKGENSYLAKIADEEINSIYYLFLNNDFDTEDLSKKYNVTRGYIREILLGKARKTNNYDGLKELIINKLKIDRKNKNKKVIARVISSPELIYPKHICIECGESYPCIHYQSFEEKEKNEKQKFKIYK